MNQRIEKITVSLPVETLRLADENRERLGFQNRSELIDASIREFVSRDILRQFSGELAELYGKIERSEMKDLEEHLSKLSYKIAVELAQVNLLLASLLEIPYDETQKLRSSKFLAKRMSLVSSRSLSFSCWSSSSSCTS
ncbi:ribbon-helix-helix protein, CopG family [Caproiciproducens sp. NJN-50]|uniref:ribbon-helix-helix domain-containing protein n=1 Tax=Caproiciproducens sp. NJN-50 TaxID=2507162 RepID=UPI000FFE1AD4|nr:ribbon-helix-helix domain-containing protein [Caproiciproducens sp. NJN-50]QAT50334.1 ribbon-helix-helix protein, CopG family [Caproiciproducens sp. NJN-50]